MRRSSLDPRSDRAKTIKRLHELWREVVYRRDGFTCQVTGKKTGLNPHHVYPKNGKPMQTFTTKCDALAWRCPGLDESIVRCVGEVQR